MENMDSYLSDDVDGPRSLNEWNQTNTVTSRLYVVLKEAEHIETQSKRVFTSDWEV